MKRTIPFAFLFLATAAALPAAAQTVQPLPSGHSEADQLADAMRTLGANPRDLGALINAGELSLRLGDASGAAALFKRADEIDSMNGRVKAGMARILVQQERPGEALRYFNQAAGYGLDPRSFAGDRGLAYDLIGEQERAQRDYRLALKAGPQDEVQRRYALSLAISGRQEEALKEIEPLLRTGDRGAWRARAFILAMGGDVAGAEKIATTMMPSGMANGLAPFFQKLPSLGSVDKAFAVHFGEVRASPARLADAKLIPPLPALGPDPTAPVRVAAAPPPPLLVEPAPDRKGRRKGKNKAPPVRIAATTPA
ncbi:MAG: tetratricopeptide repeat protein, partial [Sphingomonas bacterium]